MIVQVHSHLTEFDVKSYFGKFDIEVKISVWDVIGARRVINNDAVREIGLFESVLASEEPLVCKTEHLSCALAPTSFYRNVQKWGTLRTLHRFQNKINLAITTFRESS